MTAPRSGTRLVVAGGVALAALVALLALWTRLRPSQDVVFVEIVVERDARVSAPSAPPPAYDYAAERRELRAADGRAIPVSTRLALGVALRAGASETPSALRLAEQAPITWSGSAPGVVADVPVEIVRADPAQRVCTARAGGRLRDVPFGEEARVFGSAAGAGAVHLRCHGLVSLRR